jgi:hypothetical protein
VTMSIIANQLELLRAEFPGADIEHAGGATVVSIPNVPLGPGWSANQTTVKFVVLPNYPHSAPDCFWIDPQIRLASGAMPQNTNIQQVPGTGLTWLWFSWHVGKWNPNRDSLYTYMKVIQDRLAKPQ